MEEETDLTCLYKQSVSAKSREVMNSAQIFEENQVFQPKYEIDVLNNKISILDS